MVKSGKFYIEYLNNIDLVLDYRGTCWGYRWCWISATAALIPNRWNLLLPPNNRPPASLLSTSRYVCEFRHEFILILILPYMEIPTRPLCEINWSSLWRPNNLFERPNTQVGEKWTDKGDEIPRSSYAFIFEAQIPSFSGQSSTQPVSGSQFSVCLCCFSALLAAVPGKLWREF